MAIHLSESRWRGRPGGGTRGWSALTAPFAFLGPAAVLGISVLIAVALCG